MIRFRIRPRLVLGMFVAGLLCSSWTDSARAAVNTRKNPNIVYILADDLGIGDVRAFNPQGKVATP
ncbi:MAG: Cerebroside-sulfatase, partial [Planctomycetaceae bacterium]